VPTRLQAIEGAVFLQRKAIIDRKTDVKLDIAYTYIARCTIVVRLLLLGSRPPTACTGRDLRARLGVFGTVKIGLSNQIKSLYFRHRGP